MNARGNYTYTIEAQDIDFRRRVSLASLTNFVLITAGQECQRERVWPVRVARTGNYTWVLSRLVIDMKRMPTEGDSLSIETWIEHVSTVFTTRNFRLSDASGEVIGYAASTWAAIDMDTRRSVSLRFVAFDA
jgi:medium-chain acyl-[acyl-carrier-protein] hydrolase